MNETQQPEEVEIRTGIHAGDETGGMMGGGGITSPGGGMAGSGN